MDEMTRKAAQQACHTLLRPIASLMLKCGMTWREFADLSRLVFVEVAGTEYGIRGRPTNVSRVSILTGINRKEVRRQRELMKEVPAPIPGKTSDATRVLSAWHQDPAFVDLTGKPRLLAEEGPGASFQELCRRHGGDIPATTLLKELKRVGAVEESNGRLRVVRRYYMPVRFDGQWVLNAGSMMGDLGRSISHNLSADQQDPSRFIGRAVNERVAAADLPEFRAFIEEQGQKFLENVDAWLTAHQPEPPPPGLKPVPPRVVRLGVGVFVIQGDNQGQGS